MGYVGKVRDPSLPGGIADCAIALQAGELCAALSDGRVITLPADTLEHTREGFSGDVLCFRTQGSPSPVIQTRDARILGDLADTPAGRAAMAHEGKKRRRAWVRQTVGPLLAILGVAAAAVWFVLGPLVDVALSATPVSADRKLGEVALPGMLPQLGAEVTTPAVLEPVRALVAELAAAAPQEPRFEFRTHVVNNEGVNAFALPGGIVVVTTGLLKNAGSPDAVAGVLAHELAHVTGRHSMRQLLRKLGLWAVIAVVLGDTSYLGALVVEGGASLAELGFSREMESEADENAVELLVRARIDPTGLRRFFETLQAREGAAGDARWLKFVRSHPVTGDRVRALDVLIAKSPVDAPRKSAIDWPKLVSALP